MIRKIAQIYRNAFSGLPRAAWMLSFVELVNRSGTMVLFFLTLYLTREKGYTLEAAGQVLAACGLGSLVGAYLGGWLCDRLGAFTVQKLSLALTGVLLVTASFLSGFPAIATIWFAIGMVNEAMHPANAAAMSRVCPPAIRTKGFALNRMAVNLGVTIGPVVGGFLALVDYRYLFWVDGLTSAIAAGVFVLFFGAGEPPLAGSTNRAAADEALRSERSPWRDRPFLLLLLAVVGIGLVFIQVFSTLPIYLRTVYGLRENRIGQLLAVNTVMIVFFEMVLMDFVKRWRPLQVVALGALFFGCGFSLLPFGSSFAFAALSVAVWTVGEMLTMPLLTTVIAGRGGEANRGRYLGLFGLAFSLALMLGPIIGSRVYETFGPDVLWLGSGALALVIYLNVLALRHRIEETI